MSNHWVRGSGSGVPASLKLPKQVMDAVMGADTSKLPAVVGVALPGEGYLVARIDKLMPRDIQPEENNALKGQYAQAWARAEAEAYYRALSTRYKVSKKADPVAAAATGNRGGTT